MMIKKFILGLGLLLAAPALAQAASTATCYDTADTVLMLHMDGADTSTTFTDSDNPAHTMVAAGNAQIDTAQSKFGGASGLFDGSGDEVNSADSADWDLGTGDLTIDFWVRFANTGDRTIIDRNDNSDFTVQLRASGNLQFHVEGARPIDTAWGPSTNTWYHVALIRTGSTVRAFINGTQLGSDGSSSADIQGNTQLAIGRMDTSGSDHDGWIDEIRVVKGTAVWTSNFTPPSAAYTDCNAARRRVIVVS